ncbi:MAG: hypothetical protein IVW36_11335 [Dehalococcoidia bacterium]|nr:hypothetical protein [Dehalococcoidia bacterium]
MPRRRGRPSWTRTGASQGGAPGARRGWRRIAVLAGLALVAGVAVVGAAAVVVPLLRPGAGSDVPRAAIIDQLAVTNANEQLIQSTETMLTQAGYRVDYYGPERIDVDLFARLPKLGYKIILVRSHSSGLTGTVNDATGSVNATGSLTSLFTNERYTVAAHVPEQRDRSVDVVRLAQAVPGVRTASGANAVAAPATTRYFGITPAFVSRRMRGQFDGATVLLMGCETMRTADMANAFRARGAAAVIGWDGPVTPEHTDAATTVLLRALVAGGASAPGAVSQAMQQVGRDRIYGASLVAG